MMVRNFSGRFAITAKLLPAVLMALLWQTGHAEPVSQALDVRAVLESAVNGWSDEILPDLDPLDEQVFTEISPLIDSPESVRLPEDQQLAD